MNGNEYFHGLQFCILFSPLHIKTGLLCALISALRTITFALLLGQNVWEKGRTKGAHRLRSPTPLLPTYPLAFDDKHALNGGGLHTTPFLSPDFSRTFLYRRPCHKSHWSAYAATARKVIAEIVSSSVQHKAVRPRIRALRVILETFLWAVLRYWGVVLVVHLTTGERQTNCLPKLTLIKLSTPGPAG